MASSNSTIPLLTAAVAWVEESRPLMPMYLHIILSVLFPIYTGAHASLSRPSSAAPPPKRPQRSPTDDNDDDEPEEEETVQKMEGLTASDAIMFPITAGILLAGLYYIITRYGADTLNLLMGWYFALVGVFSVGKLINDATAVLANMIFPEYYYDAGRVWKVSRQRRANVCGNTKNDQVSRRSPLAGMSGRLPLPTFMLNMLWTLREQTRQKYTVKGFVENLIDFRIVLTLLNVLSTILGCTMVAYSVLVSTPWWLTNIQGFAVSYGALQLMSPTSFTIGSLILTGLFFYDIWAVFFTPLMVTVAKNLDVPVKLVFPRPDTPSPASGEPPAKSYSMVGLGDVVLPGIMIALALRFDLYMFYLKKQRKSPEPTRDQPDSANEVTTEKAPYLSISRKWGDRIWTRSAAPSLLPTHLKCGFPKTYFHASMFGYVTGLITTLVVMSVWKHAQPALLYLVPGVLISLWSTALLRGEFKYMREFTEEFIAEQNEDEKSSDIPAVPATAEKTVRQESKSWFGWLWSEVFGNTFQETVDAQDTGSESSKPASQVAIENESNLRSKVKKNEGVIFSLSVQRYSIATSKRSSQTGIDHEKEILKSLNERD